MACMFFIWKFDLELLFIVSSSDRLSSSLLSLCASASFRHWSMLLSPTATAAARLTVFLLGA